MQGSFDFRRKAREEMIREGFLPEFSPEQCAQAQSLSAAPLPDANDLRPLLWSSIDNAQSRDLDQAEWAERQADGSIRVSIAIADVDAVVKTGSALDAHARFNATSIYPGGPAFPMLPDRLSNDLTCLKENGDRSAVVVTFRVTTDGEVEDAAVSTAAIRNHASLSYEQVGPWLLGKSASFAPGTSPVGLAEQLRLQQETSRRLKKFRQDHGALFLTGIESVPVVAGVEIKDLAVVQEDPARDIIESFMIAANIAMAGFLRSHNWLCLRRVVRTPKRWDRIQSLAQQFGVTLPAQPEPGPLADFLAQRKQADPVGFPELSLAVLKSLGPGQYVVEHPGAESQGHFGLAANDYTHSTAPNRRYADLITQRLVKAALGLRAMPFSEAELAQLAARCTEREAAARHVERFMNKVAAALFLRPRIGQTFQAIVTGVAPKGTFVRLLDLPAEGRVVQGQGGLDIGQRTRVRLVSTDPERGFIDFATDISASQS